MFKQIQSNIDFNSIHLYKACEYPIESRAGGIKTIQEDNGEKLILDYTINSSPCLGDFFFIKTNAIMLSITANFLQ